MKAIPSDIDILLRKQTVRKLVDELKQRAKKDAADNHLNISVDDLDTVSTDLNTSVITLEEFLWQSSLGQ